MKRGWAHGFLVGWTLLLASGSADAACHRFSRWYYPYPQPRCSAPRYVAGLVTASLGAPPLPAPRPAIADMPLPDMAGIWDGEADAETRARLIALHKLRELMGK
jgi:hypothetical protein